MKFDLIERVNLILGNMNPRQQSIGREILIDNNFKIFEEKGVILMKDKVSGVVYKFDDYIKTKCNCGQ